jgi:hypothetical protein
MTWTPTPTGGHRRPHRGARSAGVIEVRPSRAADGAWVAEGPGGDLLTPRAAWGRPLAEQGRATWATAEEAMVEIDDRFPEATP